MSDRPADPVGRILGALGVLGVFLAGFLLGSWVTWRDAFPFRDLLRDGFVGATALWDARKEERASPQRSRLWRTPRRSLPGGVAVLDRERASPGLTLVLAGQGAHLVELDGAIRHSWSLPYEEARGPGALLQGSPDPLRIYWWQAHLFPDGGLAVVVDITGRSPEGLALLRLDRDSRLLWVLHRHVHHDLDVAPDGRIFVLAEEVRADPPPGLERLRGPLLDSRVLVVSPDGRVLEDLPLLEAFADSPYRALVNRLAGERRYEKGDYLHANNVDFIDAGLAAGFPFAGAGELLLSFRELSVVALLDPAARRITWARTGPWYKQHDPDFLPNGRMLLYDNKGDWDRGGTTRVIEVDPGSTGIVWRYPGPDGGRLYSDIRGDQQRLANGNTLINEQTRGRLLEVTPGGEVVWEYEGEFAVPAGAGPRRLYNVVAARRFAPGEIAFPLNGGSPGQR